MIFYFTKGPSWSYGSWI